MKLPKINIYAVMAWIAIGLVVGACGMIDTSTEALINDRGDENIGWGKNSLFLCWLGVVMVVSGIAWFLWDWFGKSQETRKLTDHGRRNG